MLWIKSLHIVFVTSWFAGLFYLPRIFVNLAMVPAGSDAERDRLLLMAHKLMRFTTVLAIPAVAFGLVQNCSLWCWYWATTMLAAGCYASLSLERLPAATCGSAGLMRCRLCYCWSQWCWWSLNLSN